MDPGLIVALFPFIIIAIAYVVLWPLVLICRLIGWKNNMVQKLYQRFILSVGFFTLGKFVSAIRALHPKTRKLATFRQINYGSLTNFLFFYFLIFSVPFFLINTISGLGWEAIFIPLLVIALIVRIKFYPIFKKIKGVYADLQQAEANLAQLTQTDLNSLDTLKSLLITRHSPFFREQVEYNQKLFEKIKNLIDADQFYILENLEEFYQKLIKRYYRHFGIRLLNPKAILFSQKYENKVQKLIHESLDTIRQTP